MTEASLRSAMLPTLHHGRLLGLQLGLLIVMVAVAVTGPVSGGTVSGAWGALLPLLVLHAGAVEGQRMPTVVAFAAGLVVDAMGGGPLGVWALTYVACLLIAPCDGFSARSGLVSRALVHGLSVVLTLALVVSIQSASVLLFAGTMHFNWDVSTSITTALVLYPALVGTLWLAARATSWLPTGLPS